MLGSEGGVSDGELISPPDHDVDPMFHVQKIPLSWGGQVEGVRPKEARPQPDPRVPGSNWLGLAEGIRYAAVAGDVRTEDSLADVVDKPRNTPAGGALHRPRVRPGPRSQRARSRVGGDAGRYSP